MLGVQIFNALEAVFWLMLAALSAGVGHRVRGFTLRRQIALTTFLAAFGVSDIWEVFTESWWNPPLLLVLKATCFVGLCVTAGFIYRSRWMRPPCSTSSAEQPASNEKTRGRNDPAP